MKCGTGGLVIGRHDEVRDELAFLLAQAFPPSAVRKETRVFTTKPPQPNPGMTEEERRDAEQAFEEAAAKAKRGDLSIRGFWERQTRCLIDVRLTDSDQPSWISKPVAKVLLTNEKEKKAKYLEECLAARQHFTPFVSTVDGVLAREASLFLKHLSIHLKRRWGVAQSLVSNFIQTKVSIAILKATHHCMRGSRITAETGGRGIGEDGTSLGLYRTSAI